MKINFASNPSENQSHVDHAMVFTPLAYKCTWTILGNSIGSKPSLITNTIEESVPVEGSFKPNWLYRKANLVELQGKQQRSICARTRHLRHRDGQCQHREHAAGDRDSGHCHDNFPPGRTTRLCCTGRTSARGT